MTIRSLTLSLTAVAVVSIFGVGCAQSPSSSSTAYTPAAANMGNAALSPDSDTPSTGNASATMSGSGNMAQSGSTDNGTTASRGTMDNSGTGMGSSTGSSTGMTTTDSSTGTRGSSSMNRSDNDSVMRAARADRN